MSVPSWVLVAVAYLVGSIPFSFLVARRWGIDDVRSVGSGNVGATNVMRSAGRVPGSIAFLLDASKGTIAVLVALRLDADAATQALVAVAAVIGHMFPVWLGFRGGKGVATGAGAFAPLLPIATASGILVFVVLLACFRYVAIASICGASTLALVGLARSGVAPAPVGALVAATLVAIAHRGNLGRLVAGTERRIGSR